MRVLLRGTRWSLLVGVLGALAAPAAQAQAANGLEQRYGEAVTAADAGRHAEAIRIMEGVAAEAADVPNVHWNLGLWYAESGQHARAHSAWLAYRQLEPGDWHVRAKLVQAFQALGDTARREEERAALLALRRAGTDSTLARQTRYCREQLRVGDRKLMVFEEFEPAGERRVFLTFHLLDTAGKELGRYSLGSYDMTTGIAREVGEIGPGERLYHLDWYEEGGHATYGFYRQMPGYDTVRSAVLAALEGRSTPISATRGAPAPKPR